MVYDIFMMHGTKSFSRRVLCSVSQRSRLVSVLALFVFLLAFSGPGAGGEADLQVQLERGKRQLESLSRQLSLERLKERKRQKQKRSLLKELDTLQAELELQERKISLTGLRLKKAEESIASLQEKRALLKARMRERERYLGLRLRALYKQKRRGGYLGILLSASSSGDLLNRYRYLRVLAREDGILLASFREESERLASLARAEEEEAGALERYRRKLELEREEGRRLRDQKERFLGSLRRKSRDFGLLQKELVGERGKLRSLIEELKLRQMEMEERVRFEFRKGRLPWPVNGVLAEGSADSKGRGVLFKASPGAAIRPVGGGRVIYADWLRGYGNLVIIDHGSGYYTVYAHASRLLVEKGERVSAGQVIARVGDTGSLTGPGLYFEIRHGGSTENAMLWLAAKP